MEQNLPTALYSDEEKELILSQIEQAAEANRLTVDADVFRPRKRGVLFPILVNVAAVALIVAAWFIADSYFQTRQKSLSLKTDQLFSAESKLLAKVLEDAKAQMEAANAEINKIQGDLDRAAADRANLQKSFESRVAAQDKALRQELADALAAEKVRLQASGLDAQEVNRRLQSFEAEKNSEFNARLDVYRKQAQAEIDKQSRALADLQSKLQANLGEQEKLRKEVESQTREREGLLQNQLSSQAVELEALRKERDELNLYFRQADASMAAVRTAVETRDWAKSQAAIASLRQVLSRASASTSEAVRGRAQAQAALVDALEVAASALDTSVQRADASAQLAAAAERLEASQRSLLETQAHWREAEATAEGLRQDIDALVARLNQSSSETFEARIDAQYFESRVGELERSLAELTQQVAAARDAQGARIKALAEVRAFTMYLRGQAASPNEAKAAIEKLAKSDEAYRLVIEDIQALSDSGAAESSVNTAQVVLYGTVAAVSKAKIVLEPLTKVKPEVGQMVELRRTKGKKETTIGQGVVLTSTKQRVEIDWAGQTGVPLSGDAAYLVLP